MAHHNVRIVADSITDSTEPTRITTFMLRYWRAFHGELLTHRVFSRCSGSSRAIPTKKIIGEVWHDPAGPSFWGANQPGMQSMEELKGWRLWAAQKLWKAASRCACGFAWALNRVGLHKQYANRGLEPYQYLSVMVTSTEYENFFKLRNHKAAMPEFKNLAADMQRAMLGSTPKLLKDGEWHLPLVGEPIASGLDTKTNLKISAARHARASYNRHDGTPAPLHEDLNLHERLVGDDPMHASPTEHQVLFTKTVMPCRRKHDAQDHMVAGTDLQGNLRGNGLVQYRKLLENVDAYRFYLGRDEWSEGERFAEHKALQDKIAAHPQAGVSA
jgi:hypothetical protein